MISGMTLKVGTTDVQKGYIGTTLVYQSGSTPIDYSTRYFTTRSLADNNTLTFTKNSSVTTTLATSISYSTDDGATWNTTNVDSSQQTISVSGLNSGDTVLWKGIATSWCGSASASVLNYASVFSATGNYEVEGNIMSLLFGDDFQDKVTLTGQNNFAGLFYNSTTIKEAINLVLPATTLTERCYGWMFTGCINILSTPAVMPATELKAECYKSFRAECTAATSAPIISATTLAVGSCSNLFLRNKSLITAPELNFETLAVSGSNSMFNGCESLTTPPPVLPAKTLNTACYYRMFEGCKKLTTAPVICGTTMATNCCYQMFSGCTSLTTVQSVLPATTLATSCYHRMFYGCTSLTTAPELPATTLNSQCYQEMFYNCTKLNYIKCLATNKSASNCTNNWVKSVASTGTFVKNASMSTATWGTGTSGIPSGWTVQDA